MQRRPACEAGRGEVGECREQSHRHRALAARRMRGTRLSIGLGWWERDHLSKLLALVRHLLLRAGDIASLWRIWVLTEDALSQAASDWLRLDDLPRLWMCQIHTQGRSFGYQAAKQRT